MAYTLADLEHARREVVDIEVRVADMRARVASLERQGDNAHAARMVLKHLEMARRSCIERLGAIRNAVGPSAY